MHLVVHPLCVFRSGLVYVCRRLLYASPAGPSLLIHSHTSSPSSAGPVELGRETRGPWILVTRCHRLAIGAHIHTHLHKRHIQLHALSPGDVLHITPP